MPYLRGRIIMANPTSSSPAAAPLVVPRAARLAPWLFTLLVVASVLLVVGPHLVIRPFAAQEPRALRLALGLVRWGPWLTLVTALAGLAVARVLFLRPTLGRIARVALVVGILPLLAAPVLGRINIYERMFHSVRAPAFVPGASAQLAPGDMVLTVRRGAVRHAFPVRAMTFHHIVNDVLDGAPIAVTYCSLCHTGAVWSRVVAGLTLSLHIGGINNQNMLMRDDETGTFWQQSTGIAVAGPLEGSHLERVASDEIGFALFRDESPEGLVLAPVAADESEYASADWEARMALRPSVLPRQGPFEPRELVLAVSAGGVDRAYPVARLRAGSAVLDRLGAVPILLLAGDDGRSLRVFDARLAGAPEPVELFADQGHPGRWVDAAGSLWTFDGCARSGPFTGRCLEPIPAMRSYWFDWREHHPATTVASSPGR